ncbi:MAG: hypothetical protein HRU19_15695 [Pseudobacteriovorax sp.]|nr:hypothetical protein [Pseudobacteriovorax sp.]
MKSFSNQWLMTIIGATLATGCVSTHINPPVESPVVGVDASCALSETVDIDEFYGVTCTLENTVDETIRFRISDISVPNPELSLVSQDDAESITDAIEDRRKTDIHNRKMGTLAVIGLGIVAILSGDSSLMTAGSVAVAGADGYNAGSDISESHRQAQYGNATTYAYREHVVGKRMTLPSRLSTKINFIVEGPFAPDTVSLCFADDLGCMDYPVR